MNWPHWPPPVDHEGHPYMTRDYHYLSIITGAPLQVLSLFEAEKYFEVAAERHLVVATPYARELMHSVPFDVSDIYEFDYRHGGGDATLRSISMLNRDLSRLSIGSLRSVFVGTPGLIARTIVRTVETQRVVLLEDGTATLQMAEHEEGRRSLGSSVAEAFRRLRNSVYRVGGPQISGATVFTPLDIDIHPCGEVVRHNFPRLQAHYSTSSSVESGLVLLLGSNEGTAEDFFDQARRAGLIMPNSRVLFKPHPSLSRAAAPVGAELVDASLLRVPAEVMLLRQEKLPSTIVGFGSTASLTLRGLLPPTVSIVDLSLRA